MTPDAKAARERKQKIFVVVGGLALLAMLAFQLPKLLGGSESSAAPTTTEPATVAGQSATGTAAPVALVGAPAATSGKLTSFSAFKAKNPFVQQVVTENELAAPGDETTKAAGSGATPKPAGDSIPKSGATTKFTTGTTTAAAVTIVTVNGARQILEPGMKFPAADPRFVLVAEKPGAKRVIVGIVGGAYSGGARTTALKVGKPVTLVDTTTGARYKITLVSVGSGDAAELVRKP